MGEANGFRRLSESTVHDGFLWRVALVEFEAPDGTRFTRDIVRSPGAVGVLPLLFDAEGNPSVVLVEQYRPPYEADVLEIPAGMRDIEGESTVEVARRELMEEAGLRAERFDELTVMYPSPGMTDSTTTLYLATHCSAVPTDRHGPEEEHMELRHLPLADAIDLVERGEIKDAKSALAILLTARRLERADQPLA